MGAPAKKLARSYRLPSFSLQGRVRKRTSIPVWCEMKTKFLLGRNVQLAFGSAILTLLVVGAISYRGMVVSSESDRWVRHTHEVLENLQNLISAMLSVESSARAFVLTGSESYLESYRAGILHSEQEETIIHNLTA